MVFRLAFIVKNIYPGMLKVTIDNTDCLNILRDAFDARQKNTYRAR